jgi:D-sedoheptulose 7-phosphate isomerase
MDEAAARHHLLGLAELATRVAETLSSDVARVADLTRETLERGGRLFFCGNGGSAADAQHLAAEYVVRFRRARDPLSALALTTDTSVLTATANDLGFEHLFARQVRAHGRAGDLLFLHSTSGESKNLLRAAEAARDMGVVTVGLLARGGGRLCALVDHALVVPTTESAHAQEIHLTIGHAICAMVESALGGESP